MAEQRPENNKPTKRTIEIWARTSLPGTIRRTTMSHAYSFRKAIFAPVCGDEHSLVLPRRSQTWKSWARRIEGRLKWLQPFLGFGERTARVCRLSSRLCMFQWEECRAAELKTPRRRGQHLRRWNQRQSERFYQTSAESLEVACTLRSFLRKKARRKILCFSVQTDQVKKCETTGFEPGKSCPGFLYVTLHCWPCQT